jgi:tetratricopeptide (TPR) repeat protein
VQLVADRFAVDDRGRAIDLASGAAVRLVWSAAGGVSEQAQWAARCARFAALHHPSIARLLDYGVCGEGRRIEAWRAAGAWRGARDAAMQALGRANWCLAHDGLTPVGAGIEAIAVHDGLPVVVPDHAAGLPTASPAEPGASDDVAERADALGVVRTPDRQIEALTELLGGQVTPRAVALSVWGGDGSGIECAVEALVRTARIAGLVPVRVDLLDDTIAPLLRGRTLLIVARDQVDAGWSTLLTAALETPKPHMVLFAGACAVSGVHTVSLGRVSAEALVSWVRPSPRTAAASRRVQAAARRAQGLPDRFERLLWSVDPSRTDRAISGAFRVAEQEAVYAPAGEPAPTASVRPVASRGWPAPGELVRLRRQLVAAGEQLARGRHVKGEREARHAMAALARRGDWVHAAKGALVLAEALAERGHSAAAESAARDARAWAAQAREPHLLHATALLLGRVLTDMGRLAEAASILEIVVAAAASVGSPARIRATLALARCLYWQGRTDEAWQRVRSVSGDDLSRPDAIRLCTTRARIAIACGRHVEAIAESARARDDARGAADSRLLAAACYANALAQLAAGDATQAAAAAVDAVRAARAAHAPMMTVCARLLAGEVARRLGRPRAAAALVTRLGRIPAARMPLVVRARVDVLRDALTSADAASAAARRAAASGLQALTQFVPSRPPAGLIAPADEIVALLQCAQAAEEDVAVLVAVCGRLRGPPRWASSSTSRGSSCRWRPMVSGSMPRQRPGRTRSDSCCCRITAASVLKPACRSATRDAPSASWRCDGRTVERGTPVRSPRCSRRARRLPGRRSRAWWPVVRQSPPCEGPSCSA